MNTDESNRLAFLRDDIKHNIDIARQHDEAGKLARKKVCLQLAEARAAFKDNQSFGKWFDASGIKLGKSDRAAAIAMGQYPEQLEAAFTETTSMSIQLIYSNNFRLPIDRKTAPAPAASRQRDHSPKTKEALKAYDRQKAAGETPTLKSVAKEAGTSDIPSRKAITIRKTEEAAIGSVDLPKSWQEKFDAKVKAFQKSFDLEVQIKAREQNLEWQKEVDFPNYMALLRKVQGMLENKHGVMKRAEFRVIQRCLHPDTGAHVSDANRNEAFRLFMSLEARLVDDDREQADLKRVSTLPRTVEEMMARRRRGGDNRKAQ